MASVYMRLYTLPQYFIIHQSNHKTKMKTHKIITCLFIAMGMFTSCDKETIRVSGDIVRTEVNLKSYTGLQVSDAFHVWVAFSDSEEKIIIEANEDIQGKIEVKKDGEDLIVGLKESINIRGNATLNVYITTKNINFFNISGASSVTLDNVLNAENLILEISGASEFTGELLVEYLDLDASGASDVDVYGTASLVEAHLEGASNFGQYDLFTEELQMHLSRASNAFLSISDKIDLWASGASTLNYKGEAAVGTIALSGSSELIKRD